MRTVRIDYHPFDLQARAIASTAKITGLVAGARGGKTMGGAFRTCADAIAQPGYWESDVESGQVYTMAVGAPTFPMLDRVVVPTTLRMIPQALKIGEYHRTKHLQRIRGRLGETWLYFISAKDPSSWQGLSLYRAWLDEFPLLKEEMFDEVQARLADRQGLLFLTGTPRGPNWAKDRIYKEWQDGSPDHAFFSWKTVHNPFIDAGYILRLKKRLPARYYSRTFEASWDTFEGQIYEDFLREVHVRSHRAISFVLPGGRRRGSGDEEVRLVDIVAGVDWGYAPGHAGVILVLGKDDRGRWWVLDESVAEGVLVTAPGGGDCWIQRARIMHARWNVRVFICDTAAPEYISQFRRAGLKTLGANKQSVLAGIETVSRFMFVDEDSGDTNFYVLDRCATTIEELSFYHWKEGSKKEEPEKSEDNTCDALRYGIHTVDGRKTRRNAA